VQIITIHAAKGLEWDVVAVAGLVDGGLPATATQGKDGPKDSAWLVGLGNLPYPLRGDREHLPTFEYEGAADPKDLEERRRRFVLEAGDHEVAEERRLAYVALTRARTDLLLTAAWWGDGTRPRKVSTFLSELAQAGLVEAVRWHDAPDEADANPRSGVVISATWPADPFATEDGTGGRRAALEVAAGWVAGARRSVLDAASLDDATAELAAADLAAFDVAASDLAAADVAALDVARPDGVGSDSGSDVRGRWTELADRLLAERASVQASTRDVELPAHLSASALVRLGADPDEFSRALRRPVPQEPSAQARLGTQFHAWVEGYFGSASLVDVDALPGADDARDDPAPVGSDDDVATLRAAFLAGPWAHRVPIAIEADVETNVDGFVLRSRIDAVFADPRPEAAAGSVVVVDWKTGAPPTDPQVRAAREIQLAVYRLAWSRWTGTPLHQVSAAFCYVRAGDTAYPDRLLGEAEIVALLRSATAMDARAT
jgi:DNA helicase II / ATP-dependent DNA helicase PcrA